MSIKNLKKGQMKARIIILFVAIFAFTACSKDDDTPTEKTNYPEENPLALYLEKSGFNQETSLYIGDSYSEQGFRFKPKVKGIIKAVTLKVPANSNNVRVTIWNTDTKGIIRTVIIPNAVAHTEKRQEIEPLEVMPTTTYLISFNEKNSYTHNKSDNSKAIYPIDAGNIEVLGFNYGNGQSPYYPNFPGLSSYWGDAGFVFQQTQ